jgi:hypothetical protein
MFTIFIYGYIFVFLSKGVYKVFEHLQWIKNEAGISQDTSSYSSESSTNNFKGSEN